MFSTLLVILCLGYFLSPWYKYLTEPTYWGEAESTVEGEAWWSSFLAAGVRHSSFLGLDELGSKISYKNQILAAVSRPPPVTTITRLLYPPDSTNSPNSATLWRSSVRICGEHFRFKL